MTANVVTVGLLSSYIKQLFESDPVLSDIWVEGEVSERFVSRAGHIYFTLRDDESQIKSVLFRGNAQRQRVLPELGDKLVVHGRVSTYERDGTYQLYVDVVEHAGAGLAALRFEQLRQKLEAEGLFDPGRKRDLPQFPQFIGVVTSEQGAVWHDIQTVLKRRYPLTHLLLSPSPVQGDAAPDGITEALRLVQEDGRAEVVIVARGGGSAEDLSCFNDERVARAVFACSVPVISAVGHETDWTIIDFVADVRAATPSAAAELVAPSMIDLVADIRGERQRASAAIAATLRTGRHEIAARSRTLEGMTPEHTVASFRNELGRLNLALGVVRHGILPQRRAEWSHARETIQRQAESIISQQRAEATRYAAVLDALSPAHVISRGFAALESPVTGKLVTSVAEVSAGDGLIAWLRDGRIDATVRTVDANPGVGHNDAR